MVPVAAWGIAAPAHAEAGIAQTKEESKEAPKTSDKAKFDLLRRIFNNTPPDLGIANRR